MSISSGESSSASLWWRAALPPAVRAEAREEVAALLPSRGKAACPGLPAAELACPEPLASRERVAGEEAGGQRRRRGSRRAKAPAPPAEQRASAKEERRP